MDKSIDQMRQDLALAGYAQRTQDRYLSTIRRLSDRFGRPVADLTREQIREFVADIVAADWSASWKRMELAAVVFLWRKTLGRPEQVSFVSWPTSHQRLPEILSLEEVHALLRAIEHLRYRTMAMVIYGGGLRLSEALALEVGDIDGSRGVLRIRHGKGDKAREVKLSPSLYSWLRNYWARERPPKPYVFASRATGKPAARNETKSTHTVLPLVHTTACNLAKLAGSGRAARRWGSPWPLRGPSPPLNSGTRSSRRKSSQCRSRPRPPRNVLWANALDGVPAASAFEEPGED